MKSDSIPLDPAPIPAALKKLRQWVLWRKEHKPNGSKVAKVPICPHTLKPANANDPQNWLTFEQARRRHKRGICAGIGIALTGQPVAKDQSGAPLYLTAIDLDNCGDKVPEIKGLRHKLGKVYAEISPSGNGVRMLALSGVQLKGGNAGNGREIYSHGRFVTVTSTHGAGDLIEATAGLTALHQDWFPVKSAAPTTPTMLAHLTMGDFANPETPENVARVNSMLAAIPADTTYEVWRNVVWAVLSTGWACAVDIAESWSKTASHRFERQAFDNLMRGFRPGHVSLGTLVHHAKANGWVDAAPMPMQSPAAKYLLTAQELMSLPPMSWCIRGVLPDRGIAAIYGPSGSGKSFLAMDMANAIACRDKWFGQPVKHAPVVYVALEGEGGISQRIKAWERHNGRPAPETLRFVISKLSLMEQGECETLTGEIIATVGHGAVVFIDTLNRAAPTADENSSADMGRIIESVKCLADTLQGIVILVHHSGKDASRGLRGHSSLYAALDAVIEVKRSTAGREWSIAKSKESGDDIRHGFQLLNVPVGRDSWGMPVSSCVVQATVPGGTMPHAPLKGANQKLAMEVINAQLMRPAAPPLPMADAVTAVAKMLKCERRHGPERARKAIADLIDRGYLHEHEGVLSPS